MQPSWILLITTMLTIWIQTSGSACAQVEKATAFVNINLAPMTEERIIPEQTVLVKGTLITAIGPSKEIDTPDNSIVIDGSNFYLIPGIPQVGT
jgi:imidazolonepropionase-like amidohydrolase